MSGNNAIVKLDGRDLNGVVEFLVSDRSNYINGQNLIIDDGLSL